MENSTEQARFNMIQQQVRPWGVLDDRVLEVMGSIAREAFVPDAYRGLAHADIEIPVGDGASMLAPPVVGRLLQALAIRPRDRMLEVGTGTGYVTACMSLLGGRLISLEIDPALAGEARARLTTLNFESIEVREGDALAGPVQGSPFDVIAITGSMPTDASLPLFQEQLAIGGRLFCILGEAPAMEAVLITRLGEDDVRRETLFETCVPVLAKALEPEGFVF